MEITIYHGSENIVIPEYGRGRPYNDYGQGLYCTENIELAKEWACAHGRDGYANAYRLSTHGLSVLDLNGEGCSILNWLAVLLDNRRFTPNGPVAAAAKSYILENFLPDYQRYDIIKGYRADDSYFSFAGDFISNSLSLRGLKAAMFLGHLGEQVVLKSEKAFDSITPLEPIPAESNEYYAKYTVRDLEARRQYDHLSSRLFSPDETYILDIIREKMKNGDPRL